MTHWSRWERGRLLQACRIVLPVPELSEADEQDVSTLLGWMPWGQRFALRVLMLLPPARWTPVGRSRLWALREAATLIKLLAGMLWERRRLGGR